LSTLRLLNPEFDLNSESKTCEFKPASEREKEREGVRLTEEQKSKAKSTSTSASRQEDEDDENDDDDEVIQQLEGLNFGAPKAKV
jgi:hypothetical protein